MWCRTPSPAPSSPLDELQEAPPLRAWLFRIAHNRALDLLRSRAIRAAEPIEAAHEVADPESPDPVEVLMRREAVETAVSRFAELPTVQRSVVILKDVLDQSLEEIAAMLDLTVNAVKAHLARGRARLKAINAQAPAQPAPRPPSPAVARYVALFNRRDWDGLRAMLADDVRLIQSTYPLRAGAADVGMFFGIYSRSAPVRARPRLARWPRGDRGLRGSSGGEAQLPDVAGVDGRPDQLHPRLPLCPLCHRRCGADPGAVTGSQDGLNPSRNPAWSARDHPVENVCRHHRRFDNEVGIVAVRELIAMVLVEYFGLLRHQTSPAARSWPRA